MSVGGGSRQVLLLGTLNTDGTYTGMTAGASVPVNMSEYDEVCITFESVGTTSGGTLLIEEASRRDYSGTWSQIASQAASGFTGTVQLATHISPNKFSWLRVRISSAITGGGTVLVFLDQRGT